MITPDEQGLAKGICLVVGLCIIGVYVAVLWCCAIMVTKGDTK